MSKDELKRPVVIHTLAEEIPDKILVRHHKRMIDDIIYGLSIVDYWYKPERHAKRIIVANGATGHCKCSACGGLIGAWDAYCKHCGARLEVD